MNRTLLIRADASPSMGSGHVMRCLALAEAWTSGAVVLRSFGLAQSWRSRAEALGVTVVDAASAGDELDAQDTAELARALRATVVVDGYHLPSELRARSLDAGAAVCWIDDGGTGDDLAATLIVNQNLGAAPSWYPSASEDHLLLTGPSYALLRPSFASRADRDGPTAERLVVTFGGSDPAGWTGRVIDAFERGVMRSSAPLATEVVLGAGVADASTIVERARACGMVVRLDVISMADVLADATVVLAAAGTTVLELACLGRPAVLVAVAENQRPVVDEAVALGIAEACRGDAANALAMVRALLDDEERRVAMSRRGRSLVDGRGACRVAAALAAL